MPRPKKGSAEAKAWGEKMKQARENKNPKETIEQNDDIQVLKRRIEELENKQFFNQPPPQAPQGVVSTKQVITKYSFDPKVYPDPREKLSAEEKLRRFAFEENYELDWKVQKVDYEEDGMKVRAPRFVLELWGKVIDEETNEIAKKYDPATKEWKEQRYVLKRGMFFEDPDSFIAVANQMGIEIPEFLQKPFLDEMRYIVMRDWLFENFFPPQNLQDKMSKKEVVINNRLVELFEINSDFESPQPVMPFGQIGTKV
jgi:hypothetical protein